MTIDQKTKCDPPAAGQALRMPSHVAIIMDGNGRWATNRGLPRPMGHRAGANTARTTVEHAARLHLRQLTLYSFSIENWKRPAAEVNQLMQLYQEYLVSQRPVMMENNIRFIQIGRRDGLPPAVCQEIDRTTRALEKNTGMTLCLAVNYGSRTEIVDALRAIAGKVRAGTVAPEQIDEAMVSDHLYTAGMADPDLLIRTAGEMRVSNYLLWQISYAELYITDVLWPEFTEAEFDKALASYAARERRFGGASDENI